MRDVRFMAVLGAAVRLGGSLLLCAAAPASAAWKADSPLPVSYVQTKTVAAGGFLYKIGGRGDKGICGAADVLVAPLNPDGSAGAWTPTTSLPAVGASTVAATCGGVQYTMSDIVIGWGYEAAYSNGFIYIMGGNLWNFNGYPDGQRIHFSSAVYYAATNADGTLGAWLQGPYLSTASFDAAGAAYNGTLYLTGGRDDAVTTNVRRDVYYSRLNPDGSPAAWQTAAAQMPGGLWLHGAEAAAGRLYISGGITYDPFPRDQITDAVYSAPLAADGTPGAWREESSLPLGLAGQGLKERHGILYTIGGQEPTFPTVSVHASAINADGTLAPWTSADPLPIPLYLHGSASGGDSLYVDGGSDGNLGQKAVYHLPDTVPPAAVADLSASAQDASSLHLQWTAPGNDGSYGSVSAGGYRLSAATDPGALASSVATAWTASFDPGAAQSWRLSGLASGTTYYVSLAAVDSSGNVAPPSNVAAAQTYFLASSTEAPPVVRFQSPTPGVTISALSGAQSATLLASAPGAAVSSLYDMQPAANLAPGLLSVSFPPAALNAGMALYEYQTGIGWSSAPVADQSVDASSYAVSGRLAQTGIVAVFGPYPIPVLTGLSPAQVVAGSSALALTVNGGGFGGSSVVLWNGAPRPTTFVSPAQLTVSLSGADVAAAGLGVVTVLTPAPGGGTSSPALLMITNPAPSLTALSPNAATAGGAAFTLTVTGAGFVGGSSVQWNGAPRATTFVSPTQLTAAITAADVASAGADAVTVVSPAPGGGTSAPVVLSVANPAPTVSALSPNTATAGGAAFTLTVTGAGFVGGSSVQWNGAPRATTFVSPTQLTAAIAAADVASAANDAVTVVTPAPGGGTSFAANFAVVVPPPSAPALTAVSPAVVAAGSAGFVLTADGSNFTSASAVQWNGAPRPTTFVSDARLTAAITAADVASAGTAVVVVVTPAPGGGSSSPMSVTVANPAPSLTALSPNTATAGGAAFTLTVTGAGFVGGSAVKWNGSARATAFVSPTQLTAAITAADVASAGADAVTVVSPAPGGGTSAPALLSVANPAPAVSALSPNKATAGGAAFTLTVTGAGFVGGSSVQWNGAPRATTFVSPTQLTAAIAAADVASAANDAVTVVTPAPGGGVSGAASFTVSPAATGGGGWPAPRVSAEWSPRTLNLDSHGRDVHLHLEVESWGRSRDVVSSSVRLTAVDGRPVPPLRAGSFVLGDDDSNGIEDENIVFDRASVAALLTPGEHDVTVAGLLADGRGFVAVAHLTGNAPAGRGARAAEAGVPAGAARHPRYWPAPANLLALRTMAWDASTSSSPAASGAVNGRIAVRLPEGAPAPSVVLTISTSAPAAAADRGARERKTTDSGLIEISSPVAFGPEGTHFILPITLELPYDRATLPAGMDESALAVNYWNPATSNWEKLPSTVDRQAQIVRAQTTHFSLYQVLAGHGAVSILPVAAPDASFALHAAYAFPNPARGAGSVTIRIQPGSVDGAEVRIYDLAGRKIHSSDAFSVNPALDDGNGLGPQITYDHVWNVSGVGSGVYTYVVRARKSGQADIVKTGKIGVIK
ncbi:MAG: IPT/TIG domain-containing protein [Elusimicrobiota bacterium]